ncbi:unnamed protein product [Orchesella dallaii]|uniref:LIM zinc-binding domain-containing protein n=1 Tax=Orchesella dallaii TaxID=48710 RepID=A0ABP1R2I6_9HEXA
MSSDENEPCTCPCHRGGGDCREVDVAHKNFQNVPPNPFVKNEPKPAAACISSSFLHAKHIVQTMKARWESFSEKETDLRKTNCPPCPQCASNIRWSRRSVDKSDQQESKSKYEDNKPPPLSLYSLEPLHRHNSTESTHSHFAFSNEQIESNNVGNKMEEQRENAYMNQSREEQLKLKSNIFDKPSRFVDTVGKMQFDMDESQTLNFKRTGSSLQLHPTNPFSSRTTGIQTIDEDKVSNEFNVEEPHSAESEVRNIRKSFEEEATKVVENVNRKSLEVNRRNWRGEAVGEQPIDRNDKDMNAKSWNIESQDREENEWKVNNNTTSAQNVPSNYNNPPPHSMQSQVRAIRDSFEDDLAQVVDGVERTPFQWRHSDYNNSIRKSFDEQLLLDGYIRTGSHMANNLANEPISKSNTFKSRNDEVDSAAIQQISTVDVGNQTPERFLTEVDLSLQKNDQKQDKNSVESHWKKSEARKSLDQTKPRRTSYPQQSTDGLVAVEVHNLFDNHNHPHAKSSPRSRGPLTTHHKKPTVKDASTSSNEDASVEHKESTYVAWISMPTSKFTENDHSSSANIHNSQEKLISNKAEITNTEVKSDVTIGVQEVDTKSSFALEMDGRGIRRATLDKEDVLNKMASEYDHVIATPSNLQVEAIGRSVSVTNAAAVTKEPLKVRTKRASSGDTGRGSVGAITVYRRNPYHICHKCHKIVEKNEASFHLVGGFDTAWHRHCFKCHACEKQLSEDDHSFFEDKPYCIADYINVAKIQKCFKCHELIFDSTYTSASGHFWHREHFTCQSCKKSLVDTKYVLVRKKYPYCFQCHEKDFPKFCKICQGRISPQEPYVQSGETFWHSNDTCLHCSSCKRSLVGRSLFFRKDGLLYCNRYCAVRGI